MNPSRLPESLSHHGPLAGIGVLITRPVLQSATFAQRLSVLGGTPFIFPALVIAPPADPRPLARTLRRLFEFDFALFVSANAVDAVIAQQVQWPSDLIAIAVGPTTADALISGGIANVIAPAERYDSEGVLALDVLQDVRGKRIVFFRGEDPAGGTGRELMRTTLESRGAIVEAVSCYQRRRPTIDAAGTLTAWRDGNIDAVVATSAEVVDNFLALIGDPGRSLLMQTPLFVPHPRIAAHARTRGLDNVVTTEATDAGLLAGLLQHFSKPQDNS